MNKIQMIELLSLRGITELKGISIGEAIRRSGGDPTDDEMIEVKSEIKKKIRDKKISSILD